MQPLEAARRALRLTRLEGLAASTAFLNTDDEAVAAKMQGDDTSAAYGIAYGALLLFLWCMSFYAQGGVRRASFVLYLVACGHVTGLLGRDQVESVCEVVVRMAGETRRALWGDVLWGHSDSWVMAAIACVVGYIVPKVKSEHPDAHEGHLDSFYGTYSIPSTRQHANSIWLLLHAALRSYTGPPTHCFHYFAGTLLTNFLGLVAHNQLIPSRSAPIGVAACLLPYDRFFVFCLTLAQSGWSYIYWSCVDFPLTFCLNICVKVVTELRAERADAPCFGAMTHAAIQPQAA